MQLESTKMENIGWFVNFITEYGVQQEYIFVTVDLYEKQNVWGVVLALRALKDKTQNEEIKSWERDTYSDAILLNKALWEIQSSHVLLSFQSN
ncbi:hypothetical protein AC249_AIPGENE26274 [Exaiptasia diaphana]|nr:hypothetical protein AC249_AIPGENE26274 [Exaiptasia diaphana]